MRNRVIAGLLTAVLTPIVFAGSLPSLKKHTRPSVVQVSALNQALSGRGLGQQSEASHLIDVPAPGLLALELSVPAYHDHQLWLDLLPTPHRSGETEGLDVHVLSRSFNRQVVAIPAADTYQLRIGNMLPHEPTGDYSIAMRFLDRPMIGNVDWIANKDGNEGGGGNGVEESDNEIVPLILPDPNSEEHSMPTSPHLDLNTLPWCRTNSDADIDLWFCARRLVADEVLSGELDPAADADRDDFTFSLKKTVRIHVRSHGNTDTFGSLYDMHGHRLMCSDNGGKGKNFALSRILIPGRYFVRVEGAWGASGPYKLTLAIVDL